MKMWCFVHLILMRRNIILTRNFDRLPEDIKNELKIMCVLFTEEVGGILDMEFDEEGNLLFKSTADEEDLLYDDIACGLLVKKNQYGKKRPAGIVRDVL